MIDSSLIDLGKNYCTKQLENIDFVNGKKLGLINNFFPSSVIDKLKIFIHSAQHWEYQENPKNGVINPERQRLSSMNPGTQRFKLTFQHDTIMEELYEILNGVTSNLSVIFNKDLSFNGVFVWKDLPGYFAVDHVDNPEIEIAIQIYLTEHEQNIGTIFFVDNKIVETNYKINEGYIMDNSYAIRHRIRLPIPQDHIRYSVYANWKKPINNVNLE